MGVNKGDHMPRTAKPKAGNPTLAIGYVRVSTEDQHLGPEAQRAAMARWCAANGIKLAIGYEDLGVSGGAQLEKRPGLLAALDALAEHGAGVLLVAKRDRLARDVVLAAMVERLAERNGAHVMSADGISSDATPEGQLQRVLMDAFAQYERAVIRARTTAALAVKKSRAERVGGIPYGFKLADDGVALVPDADEQARMATVLELRAAGLSFKAVAERLNADGVPARGTRWHPTTIDRLLRRAA